MRNAVLLFLLLSLSAVKTTSAEPCPLCPPGCIPQAFVQSLKAPTIEVLRSCPEGCVALEKVKILSDVPGCQFDAKLESVSKSTKPENQRSTINRGIYFPTAMDAPVGEFSMTGYGAGLWDLQYNLNENLQIGAQMVLPVYVSGVFPSIRARFDLSENVAVGVGGLFGLAGPYAGDEAGDFIFLAGGHTQISFQFGRHLINVGLAVLTAGFREEGKDIDMVDGAILLPNLSYRWAFHRNWSTQVELTAPLLVNSDGLLNEEAVVIMAYGVRGHGDILFGDVGFFLPIFDDYIENAWKYTPFGIPYFSIGFVF